MMKVLLAIDIGCVRDRTYFSAFVWILLLLLGACGVESKHESDIRSMAKVNGEVITVREFNDRYAGFESRAGFDLKAGKKQVLGALVDEKLLVQEAIRKGLDRETQTVSALDRARRQILVQASIDHAAGPSLVSDSETKTFYGSHPELFERRKTYLFRRFDLSAAELAPSLKFELDQAGSPAKVGFILKNANVKFTDQTEIRAAETFPIEILKQVAEMQRGDILIVNEASRIVLLQLMRNIPEPVDLARAAPAIRSYLVDNKKRHAAEELLRTLRERAKIEYSEGTIDGSQVQADAGPFESVNGVPNGHDASRTSAANRWR
jgi:peptidyl-prolyl cis-trans isomerase C